MEMCLAILFIIHLLPTMASAAILQNPDFELSPSNSTSPSVLINENNTLPGWTAEGTVQYLTAGPNVHLPRNGHAILLAQDAKINQTFTADGDTMQYLLTFTLAVGGRDCSANISLVVSAPDSDSSFSLQQNYSRETWQIYGHRLGSWGGGDSINLVLQSQVSDPDINSTCWPVVDTLQLKTIGRLSQGQGNLLPNGGFELGPAFLDNFTQGVLLDPEPSLAETTLQQWSVTGTIKYIGSKSYYVPEGSAAVELISGVATGIHTSLPLSEGSSYNLEFVLGDANDSCKGDFTVGVQAGSSAQNFTFKSNGTGSATKFTMAFKAVSGSTPLAFQSLVTRQDPDGVFCGPLIDDVVLRSSWGCKPQPSFLVTILLLGALLHICVTKD